MQKHKQTSRGILYKPCRDLAVHFFQVKRKYDMKSTYATFCNSKLQNEVVFSATFETCVLEKEYLVNMYFKYFYSQHNILFPKL